jgi:hypothetical protein
MTFEQKNREESCVSRNTACLGHHSRLSCHCIQVAVGGLVVCVLALDPRFAGLNPAEGD